MSHYWKNMQASAVRQDTENHEWKEELRERCQREIRAASESGLYHLNFEAKMFREFYGYLVLELKEAGYRVTGGSAMSTSFLIEWDGV